MSSALTNTKMSREAYYAWCEQQPRGRFERIEGEIVAMAPERVGHMRMKAAVWRALSDAILYAGLSCEALPDGATVPTGDSDYEPDALVNCGDRLPRDTTTAATPVIVVEVLSPGTRSIDTGAKLVGYFSVASIQHYLIIHPTRRQIVHHRRGDAGRIDTAIVTAGTLRLDPPGLDLDVGALYDAVGAE